MILMDYGSFSTFTFMSALKHPGFELNESGARSLILNFIREFRAKHHAKYGEVVIACDGDNYWRRGAFPLYKYPRKKSKEDSKHDWVEIKRLQNLIRDELKEFMPYPVIDVPRAEADDVIGILAEWGVTNDVNEDGLFERANDTLIISADGDYFQLQKHKNIRQISPMTMKFAKPDMPLDHFVVEHILTGDGTDGIPNILSPDDFFKAKEDGGAARQKPVTATIKKFYFDQIDEYGEIIEWRSEEEKANYERNFKLVHFDAIPKDVRDDVIESYLEQKEKKKMYRTKLLNYFVKKQLTNLMPDIGDF